MPTTHGSGSLRAQINGPVSARWPTAAPVSRNASDPPACAPRMRQRQEHANADRAHRGEPRTHAPNVGQALPADAKARIDAIRRVALRQNWIADLRDERLRGGSRAFMARRTRLLQIDGLRSVARLHPGAADRAGGADGPGGHRPPTAGACAGEGAGRPAACACEWATKRQGLEDPSGRG